MVLLAIGVTVPFTVVAYRSLRLLQLLANREAQLQQWATTDWLTVASSAASTLLQYLKNNSRAHSASSCH